MSKSKLIFQGVILLIAVLISPIPIISASQPSLVDQPGVNGNGNPASPRPTLFTFTSKADSYVDQQNPTTNYGKAYNISVASFPTKNAYLKFNVTGFSGVIKQAILQVYATNKSNAIISVRGVANNDWDEYSITYSNAPSLSRIIAGSSKKITNPGWVSIDITALVRDTGVVSIGLTCTNEVMTNLMSREAGLNQPKLVVYVYPSGTSTPTATSTPTKTLTPTPTNTPTPTDTPTATATPTDTTTPTVTYTPTPTDTFTPTPTSTYSPTPTDTYTPTPTATETPTPTDTNTPTPTNTTEPTPDPIIDHCGTISADETWQAGDVHRITCTVSVNQGVTLTLSPGAIVKFMSETGLFVDGNIVANGTTEDQIHFTSYKDDSVGGDSNEDGNTSSPAPGDWAEIWLYGTGNLNLDHAIVRYGGGSLSWEHGTIMAYLTSSPSDGVTASISNSVIEHNTDDGVYLRDEDATTLSNLSINSSVIRNNGRNGVSTQGVGSVLLANNVLSNNGATYIGSAALIYAQTAIVSGNTFTNNPSGLSLGADSITLTDNLFIDQTYEHAFINSTDDLIFYGNSTHGQPRLFKLYGVHLR